MYLQTMDSHHRNPEKFQHMEKHPSQTIFRRVFLEWATAKGNYQQGMDMGTFRLELLC